MSLDVYACVSVNMRKHAFTCVWIVMCACTYVCACTNVCACVSVHTREHKCVRACVSVHGVHLVCVCVPPYVPAWPSECGGRAVTLTYITHLIGYFNGTTSEINKYINKQSNSPLP